MVKLIDRTYVAFDVLFKSTSPPIAHEHVTVAELVSQKSFVSSIEGETTSISILGSSVDVL